MEFWAQLHTDGLHPIHNSDSDTLSKLKLNTDYKFVVTKPRNIGRHRMFFAMINMVYENQEQYNNTTDLREQLTIAAGYFRNIETLIGTIEKRAQSISFSKMDDIEFNDYYKAVWGVIAKWLDMSDEMMREELVNYL